MPSTSTTSEIVSAMTFLRMEINFEDDKSLPITFPRLVWIPQNGKKYHTSTACVSVKHSQPTSRGLRLYCKETPALGTSEA